MVFVFQFLYIFEPERARPPLFPTAIFLRRCAVSNPHSPGKKRSGQLSELLRKAAARRPRPAPTSRDKGGAGLPARARRGTVYTTGEMI